MTRDEPVEPNPDQGHVITHLGHALYWQRNEAGGRTYCSDEIPCGVHVWDTCLTAHGTLCEAISVEFGLQAVERRAEQRERLAHQRELQTQAGRLFELFRAPKPAISARQLVALLNLARTQLQLMPDATSQRIADEIAQLIAP